MFLDFMGKCNINSDLLNCSREHFIASQRCEMSNIYMLYSILLLMPNYSLCYAECVLTHGYLTQGTGLAIVSIECLFPVFSLYFLLVLYS